MKTSFARLANTAHQAARTTLRRRPLAPAYPSIEKCPSPTCECADMPHDLDIERKATLHDTMAAHAEELLVCTGQSDWAKKIEDEKDTAPWGEFVYNVKQVLGKGGEHFDPYRNVTVNTCSFSATSNNNSHKSVQTFLFPSFKVIDRVDPELSSVTDFVKTFLLPLKLHPQHASLPEDEKRRRLRNPEDAKAPRWAGKVRPISAPVVMVCSHNSRDMRCGVLGPLLHAEFTQYINKRRTLRNRALPKGSPLDAEGTDDTDAATFASHPKFRAEIVDHDTRGMQPINVGMVSHIGGHKWAGNVIVYIPPDYHCFPIERISNGSSPQDQVLVSDENTVSEQDRNDEILESGKSPLAGKIVWYGRVEPKHVEGIVEQTIGHGRIIRELFRGGVDADGSYLRI